MVKRELIGAVVIFVVVLGAISLVNRSLAIGTDGWVFALMITSGVTVGSIINAKRREARKHS